MMNNDFPNIAKEYKRTIAGRFMLVEGAKLKDKLPGEDFLVTKKWTASCSGYLCATAR